MRTLTDEQRARALAANARLRAELEAIATEAGVKDCDTDECQFPFCIAYGCDAPCESCEDAGRLECTCAPEVTE